MSRTGVDFAGPPLVVILQPYVPRYRVALFEHLDRYLADAGYRLLVVHGEPKRKFASRGDAVLGPWSRLLRSRSIEVGNFHLQLRSSLQWAKRSSVVVSELASTNLDTYALAARSCPPLMLWGHGRSAVTKENRLDSFLELRLAKRAAHVLSYTTGGKVHLAARGVPSERITVVQNSTDTRALTALSERLADSEIDTFRAQWGITASRVACFIGALDPSKRLDLLLDASRLIAADVPDFQLIVAGDGPSRALVEARLPLQPEVRLLPYADQRMMAMIGQVSQLMLMPGRVGLIAVDAMAMGLPVITTDWPLHAPEREYLQDTFCDTVHQDAREISAQVTRRLGDQSWLEDASVRARNAGLELSIENMSARMGQAIISVANDHTSRSRKP